MSKRKYTKMDKYAAQIAAMRDEGRTRQEIADALNLDFDQNRIVAYKTSSQQTVSLVLDTIRLAMKKEKKIVAAELQLHSDQGFQYTSQAYFKLTQSYRQCQDVETHTTMQWQKISCPS